VKTFKLSRDANFTEKAEDMLIRLIKPWCCRSMRRDPMGSG